MSRYYLYLLFLVCAFLFSSLSISDNINFRGTVLCREKGKIELEKTTKCVIVVPQDRIKSSSITDRNGFFGFNIPYNAIINKPLIVYFYDYQGLIKRKTKYIYDEDIIVFGNNRIFKFGGVNLGKNCEVIEGDGKCLKAADYFFRQLIFRDINRERNKIIGSWKIAGGVTGIGLPAILLAGLGGAAGADSKPPPPPPSIEYIDIESISPKQNINGKFLSLAIDGMAKNSGFQISPTRNISDSVFFNSSAVSFAPYGQFNFHSDFDRYYQASICSPIKNGLGIGLGLLFLRQEETRIAYAESNVSASSSFRDDELGIFLSLSKKVRENIAVGVTAKFISQELETPFRIKKSTFDVGNGSFNTIYSIDITKKKVEYYDWDINTTYKVNSRFQVGCSIMNIGDTELLSKGNDEESIRALGLGLSYKIKKIHLGSDILISQEGHINSTVGINAVPFSNAEISLGYGSAFDTIVVSGKYRIFKVKDIYFAPTISFIKNDNFDESFFFGLNADY